jgi:hypothetical protein
VLVEAVKRWGGERQASTTMTGMSYPVGKGLPGTRLIRERWKLVGRSLARACGFIDHRGDEEPTGVEFETGHIAIRGGR